MSLNQPAIVTTSGMLKKMSNVETTALLGAAQTFQGQWHDSLADGTIYVMASALSNQAGGINGFNLQETEDVSSATMTRTIGTVSGGAANNTQRIFGIIRARYWRVTYLNGATAQGTFSLFTSAMNFVPPGSFDAGAVSSVITLTDTVYVSARAQATAIGDNLTLSSGMSAPNTGSISPLNTGNSYYGGAFSGSANATRVGWTKARTPTIYNTASAVTTGDNAVWTPAANNKFRLLRYQIEVTSNSSLAAGAILVITLRDNVTDTLLTHSVFVPTTAITTGGPPLYVSDWQDLGFYGYLSAAANNVLNINLSATLSTGAVRIRVAGTEE